MSKRYGDVVAVARQLDLEVATGEFFTLLGPSGSGKTTTLRMIAGFEEPDAGHDRARRPGRRPALPPYDRDVNTVFQDYALFPHMTVGENVEYGLRVKRVGKDGARDGARRGARHGAAGGLRASASRASSPAASASASRWRARSSTGPGCCCSTSRSARST